MAEQEDSVQVAEDNSSGCQLDQSKADWRHNHLVLESIFKNLDFKDLKSVSLVCSSWCWASAKFLSEKSLVHFLDHPSRSIEKFLEIQQECRVWEGPVRLRCFEFMSECRISKWLLMKNPCAESLGEQMTQLTIRHGKAEDVNLLMARLCQKFPNLKSLKLRCSYSGLRDENSQGWMTSPLEDEDCVRGLVHTKLEVLQTDLTEYCRIKWDFLQTLVALRALSIGMFDCDRDAEPIVVDKIQEITSSLASRVKSAAFQYLEITMPLPASQSTTNALYQLLHLLKPLTYALKLRGGRNSSQLSIVQDILQVPPSVVNFKLELAIASPQASDLDASGIGQAYESIVKGVSKRRRFGFLFRLKLVYQIEIFGLASRFVEIDSGRAEGLQLRIGKRVWIGNDDRMLLDWVQRLLSVVFPRHERVFLFRYHYVRETINHLDDWLMFLLKDDSGTAGSLKFSELMHHTLGGSDEVENKEEFERLKPQMWDSERYDNPFVQKPRCRYEPDIESTGCIFVLCPAKVDAGL